MATEIAPHHRSGEPLHAPGLAVDSPDSRFEDHDDSVTIVLDVSPELDDAMEIMAIDLEGSKSDLFVRAMALFQLVINAKKRGKRICVVDDDLNIETEIIGFGPLDDDMEAESARPRNEP